MSAPVFEPGPFTQMMIRSDNQGDSAEGAVADVQAFHGWGLAGMADLTLIHNQTVSQNFSHIDSHLLRGIYRGQDGLYFAEGTGVPTGSNGAHDVLTTECYKYGDGGCNGLAVSGRLLGGGTQGYQAATAMIFTIAQTDNATLFSNIHGIEGHVADSVNSPTVEEGIISAISANNSLNIQRDVFAGACITPGAGSPCWAGLALGFLEGSGPNFLYGIDMGRPTGSGGGGQLRFLNAATSNGDAIAVEQGTFLTADIDWFSGIGGLYYILPQTNQAGVCPTQAGTTVSLSLTGGGGGAASAIVSNNGAVLYVYVTTPGSYSTVPTATMTCTGSGAIAPAFTVYLRQDKKVIGTDVNGVTQIWGADNASNASLTARGSIKVMNFSTGNPMVLWQGNTGGGYQGYNGATAPANGDEGGATINLATGGGYFMNGVAGVTCSGSPTASFAAASGIVTHC